MNLLAVVSLLLVAWTAAKPTDSVDPNIVDPDPSGDNGSDNGEYEGW